MKKRKLPKRIKSFGYAFNGVFILIKNERNAQIHCVAAVSAITLGWWLQISPIEWGLVVIVIGTVLATEALNTSLEILADVVSPKYSSAIKQVKDVAAAAVLFTAIAAAVVGCIVFLPKLLDLFNH